MFNDLHFVIQAVMGWENFHLYQFILANESYIGDPEELEFDDIADDKETELSSIFFEPKTKALYEYDFGDGWQHELVLEKILEKNPDQHYPVCIGGEFNCPPEDCGGIYGIYDMLNTLKDKKHPDYDETKEWIGDDYNPDYFDIKTINKYLRNNYDIDKELN